MRILLRFAVGLRCGCGRLLRRWLEQAADPCDPLLLVERLAPPLDLRCRVASGTQVVRDGVDPSDPQRLQRALWHLQPGGNVNFGEVPAIYQYGCWGLGAAMVVVAVVASLVRRAGAEG